MAWHQGGPCEQPGVFRLKQQRHSQAAWDMLLPPLEKWDRHVKDESEPQKTLDWEVFQEHGFALSTSSIWR